MTVPEFHKWPKTARADSPVVVTEKLDGTNAVIWVSEDETEIAAGSRNRWLYTSKLGVEYLTTFGDNYGFGAWVHRHANMLKPRLGPGWHYGEWWGHGIARGYGLDHKIFTPFYPLDILPSTQQEGTEIRPLTVLYEGPMNHAEIQIVERSLKDHGSVAVEGYLYPEGIVIRFDHNGVRFKRVMDKTGPVKPPRDTSKPRKPQWTQEQIDAARKAAAERKEHADG